jgi:hypothetical protein
MAEAAAVVGAITSIAGVSSQRSAAKRAAEGQQRAAIENVQFLQEQGRAGAGLIGESAAEAAQRAALIPGAAISQIQPFQQAGTDAFQTAQQQILTGSADAGGIGRSVAGAAGGVQIPGQAQSDVVQREMQRQAGLLGQGVAPQVQQSLLGLGRQGLAAAGDVAGITTRAGQRLGDIGAQATSQQATALIGQLPQISQQITSAGEAQLLGQLAGGQARTQTIEQLARLAGRVS